MCLPTPNRIEATALTETCRPPRCTLGGWGPSAAHLSRLTCTGSRPPWSSSAGHSPRTTASRNCWLAGSVTDLGSPATRLGHVRVVHQRLGHASAVHRHSQQAAVMVQDVGMRPAGPCHPLLPKSEEPLRS